jgi:hypothetical protein
LVSAPWSRSPASESPSPEAPAVPALLGGRSGGSHALTAGVFTCDACYAQRHRPSATAEGMDFGII